MPFFFCRHVPRTTCRASLGLGVLMGLIAQVSQAAEPGTPSASVAAGPRGPASVDHPPIDDPEPRARLMPRAKDLEDGPLDPSEDAADPVDPGRPDESTMLFIHATREWADAQAREHGLVRAITPQRLERLVNRESSIAVAAITPSRTIVDPSEIERRLDHVAEIAHVGIRRVLLHDIFLRAHDTAVMDAIRRIVTASPMLAEDFIILVHAGFGDDVPRADRLLLARRIIGVCIATLERSVQTSAEWGRALEIATRWHNPRGVDQL